MKVIHSQQMIMKRPKDNLQERSSSNGMKSALLLNFSVSTNFTSDKQNPLYVTQHDKEK